MDRNRPTNEGLQRLILACAIRGDLLAQLPSAVQPELFGSTVDSGTRSPRQLIATAISAYWATYGSRPVVEVFRELTRQAGERLGEAERAELDREVERVLAWDLPEDTKFVVDQVREWAEYRALEQGIMRAADLMAAGPSAVAATRELLQKAATPIAADDGAGRGPLGQQGLGDFLASARLLPPLETYIEGLLSSEGSGWLASRVLPQAARE